MPAGQHPYFWDHLSLRYRERATGRFVAREDVFRLVDSVNRYAASRMRALAARLRAGALGTREFQRAMRAELRALHAVNAAASAGGWRQMTAADWGRVGARLKKEYGHLESFARDLSSGRLPLSSGLVNSRAASYENNARLAYWAQLQATAERAGLEVMATRELGPVASEHCEGCEDEAEKEPRPISEVAPIGSQECLWFCRCRIVITGVRPK